MDNALRRQELPRQLERQSEAQRMLAPRSEANISPISGMNNALRRQEQPRQLERQSEAQRMLAPQSEANISPINCTGHPRKGTESCHTRTFVKHWGAFFQL